MHLYERFNIEILDTFPGRHPTEVFSECFEYVRRTFLQNFKNKEQLTFNYLTSERLHFIFSKN